MKDWSGKEDQSKEKFESNTNNHTDDNIINQLKKKFENIKNLEPKECDEILRNLISHYEKPNKELDEMLQLVDINYINESKNNSNIMMASCQRGEPDLIEKILDNTYFNKENEIIDIDLFHTDKDNGNYLHYLLKIKKIYQEIEAKNNEAYLNIIFEKAMNYAKNDNKDKIELLAKEDKNGITPLNLILLNGLSSLLNLYFKYFKYKPHVINSNKNNYIHCAIEGKKLRCLKSILDHCSKEELEQQNIDGYTPLQYAEAKKLYCMSELIKQIQSNFDIEEMKSTLLSTEIDTNELINILMNKDYSTLQQKLNKCKINQSIYNSIQNDKIWPSYKWNELYAKRYKILNLGIREEKVFSKLIKSEPKDKVVIVDEKNEVVITLQEFNQFFNKYINELTIKDHLDHESNSIDILVYNKIIFYYKICDYDSFLKYINLYLRFIYPECKNDFNCSLLENNNNDIKVNYYKYITFINISFLLVEYCIKENNEELSDIIIDSFVKYFNENINKVSNTDKFYEAIIENRITLRSYLNNLGLLNPLNSNLKDSLCYFYLIIFFYIIKFNSSKLEINKKLEIINKLSGTKKFETENEDKDEEDEEDELDNDYNINPKILNTAKQNIKKLKLFMNSSNLLPNFANRFKFFYYELKSHLYYLLGDMNKSISKLNNIKKKFAASMYNKSNEYKIFYYNSQGIINLKLKKFRLAEHFFHLGIQFFHFIHDNVITQKSITFNDIVINRLEYLYKMKFNLGLALFYQHNYLESYHVFDKIKDAEEIKDNVFFWSKFGLTCLNLYLIGMRKNKQKYKKYFDVLNKNKNKKEIKKDIIQDERSGSSTDELYEEYENKYCKSIQSDDYNINNKNNTNKIFIENEKIDEYDTDNFIYKGQNLGKIEKFLDLSINSFKKVLSIYRKLNININEVKTFDDLKGIFEFYRNYINESREFKTMIFKQNLNKKKNIPKTLIYSCYLNLLFTYHLKKKYLEMLLLIKTIKKKEKSLPNNITRKINYYELLSLINLNKTKLAEELINKEMNKYGNIDSDTNNDFDCFNTQDFQIEKDINHKMMMEIGQVFVDYKNKKYEDAEGKLMNIIKNNYNGNEDISRYYYQLLIYVLSTQNKKSKIISLIKYRWNQIQNKNNLYKDNNG